MGPMGWLQARLRPALHVGRLALGGNGKGRRLLPAARSRCSSGQVLLRLKRNFRIREGDPLVRSRSNWSWLQARMAIVNVKSGSGQRSRWCPPCNGPDALQASALGKAPPFPLARHAVTLARGFRSSGLGVDLDPGAGHGRARCPLPSARWRTLPSIRSMRFQAAVGGCVSAGFRNGTGTLF